MKNNIKILILGIVIGIVSCSMTAYAAYQYVASEVSYSPSDKNWKVESVEEALNELHKQTKNSAAVYGVVRELNTSTSKWARIGSSVELEANAQVGTSPVKNDFDSIYPWSDIVSYNYDTDTKKIIAYYGEENFTFAPTGNVEVLTRIPEFYYKRYQDDTYEYIYISKEAIEGYTKSEEFSVGRYTMSGDATRVHSKSGTVPLTNTTITDFRNYARNLGEEFGQLDYHYFILQLLYLVEYADYNSQLKLGPGYTNNTNSAPIQSGGCDTLGMKSGSVDGTDRTSIIYRGIEDIFGNVYQMIDGINVKNNQTYVCYDKNQYESDKFDGCYQPIGYVSPSGTQKWISKLGYDKDNPLIALPTEIKGSNSTTYITDHFWLDSGIKMVTVGAGFYHDVRAGMWNWSFGGYSTARHQAIGARLLKIN